MRRIIAYIYNYKKDGNGLCRCGNAGFCRVEQGDDKYVVKLCFKDACKVEGEGKIYILKCREELSLYEKGGMVESHLVCNGNLDTKLCIEASDGMLMECGGKTFIALWSGDVTQIYVKDAQEHKERACNENAENKRKPVYKVSKKKEDTYEEYTRIYNRLCKSRMILNDIEYPAVKLKLQELMLLPRSCWRLTNNGFLMDGYYRYKHILFLKYDERYVLAVPSLDGEKIDKVAERFGFTKKVYGHEYGHREFLRPYWIKIIDFSKVE